MTVLLVLIPLSVAMAAVGLGAFVWSVRNGQLDDLAAPPERLFIEDIEAIEDMVTPPKR